MTATSGPTARRWSARPVVPAALEPSDGYLTARDISGLPTDPPVLKRRLIAMARRHGYDMPGERPELGLYRLACDLLVDPGVGHAAKAAIFRVLAGLDLRAIQARNLGRSIDAQGRHVVTLQFRFEEDAVDRMVVDERDGNVVALTTRLASRTLLGGQIYLVQELVAAIPR